VKPLPVFSCETFTGFLCTIVLAWYLSSGSRLFVFGCNKINSLSAAALLSSDIFPWVAFFHSAVIKSSYQCTVGGPRGIARTVQFYI
jgi:hypothetical protein